jgi:hypothetical protein
MRRTPRPQTWTAHVRKSLTGCIVVGGRRRGGPRLAAPDLPPYVRQWLLLPDLPTGGHRMMLGEESYSWAELVAAHNDDTKVRVSGRHGLDAWVTFTVTPPPPERPRICEVDVDAAFYEGSSGDGVYYDVARGPGGWFMSAIVDSDTGSFVDTLVQDDGPYRSKRRALQAGQDAARDWCYTNDVPTDESGEE